MQDRRPSTGIAHLDALQFCQDWIDFSKRHMLGALLCLAASTQKINDP
ncbi:hypothetical protein EV681_4178 [Advenella incenata]|jgi:hypothetical protein|uniref:Uncharacterized protein n=1 Tax=Advenella incenata TaxID=267800 RepID=A0A4Q7V6M9_9BURK|nr:hypothetical protein EV681_4178 [Advenella incenata]